MGGIDWRFIAKGEGGRWTQGYVPTRRVRYLGTTKYDVDKYGPVIGQSGVTVATGFDIGQHNAWELTHQLVLSAELCAKLQPYTLLKRMDAILQLEKTKGLTISDAQAVAIDAAVRRHYLRKLPENYNRVALSKKKLRFEHLPDEIQTAIASFAYQYGVDVNHAQEPRRSYWGLVTSQDFVGAASLLERQPEHVLRRRNEAALMRKGLTKLMVGRAGR